MFCAFFTSYWNRWISSWKVYTIPLNWIESETLWKIFFFILMFVVVVGCSCSHSCYFTQVTQHIFHVHNPQLEKRERKYEKSQCMSSLAFINAAESSWSWKKYEKKALQENITCIYLWVKLKNSSLSQGSSCWNITRDEDFPTAALNAFYTHNSCRISQDVLSCLMHSFIFLHFFHRSIRFSL